MRIVGRLPAARCRASKRRETRVSMLRCPAHETAEAGGGRSRSLKVTAASLGKSAHAELTPGALEF